jgi:2-polyprenyl-3-methyl-5-hydroxy-6-metoxy-1,4-benzoquinol methylase
MSLEKHNLESVASPIEKSPFTKATVEIDWSTGIEMATWWDKLGQFRYIGDIARVKLLEYTASKLSGQEVYLTRNNEQNALILPDLRGKTVVDIGCGPGKMTIPYAHLGAQVVGIDNNLNMIIQARKNQRDLPKNLNDVHNRQVYLQHDVCDLSKVLGDEVADAAMSAGVAIFIPPDKIEPFISEQARILKNGGHLAISTTNYELANPSSPPKLGTAKIADLTKIEDIEISLDIDGQSKQYLVQNIEEKYNHSIVPATESQSFNLYLYPNQLFIDLAHKYGLKLISIEDVPVTEEYLSLSDNWRGGSTGYSYNTLFYFQKI